VVVIDVKKKSVVAEFHEYLRLTAEEAVTQFCTDLTGITNEMCMSKKADGSWKCSTFEETLVNLNKFMETNGLLKSRVIFMSKGDFDGKHLGKEAKFKNVNLPEYFNRWINICKAFPPANIIPKPEELKDDTFDTHHLSF